jgi:hypothetical protein
MVSHLDADPEPVIDLTDNSVFFPLTRHTYQHQPNGRGKPVVTLLYLDDVVHTDRLDLPSNAKRLGFASAAAKRLLDAHQQNAAPSPAVASPTTPQADDKDLQRQRPLADPVTLMETIADELVQLWMAVPQFDLASSEERISPTNPYIATAEGIRLQREGLLGTVEIPITNFHAVIVKESVLDLNDDHEWAHHYVIEATVADRAFSVELTPEEFYGVALLAKLGAEAVIYPGGEQHARVAIKLLSGPIPLERVLAAPGWWTLEGTDIFVHAAGAITADGARDDLHIALETPFDRFGLPVPPRGAALTTAVGAVLRLRSVVPDRIAFAVIAYLLRAPLDTVTYALHFHGRSGTFKTSCAALVQQGYGAGMDGAHPPAGWQATANALERRVHLAKDVVLLIDDAVPGTTYRAQQELAHNLERVFRGLGNQTARSRLRANATARPDFLPRGGIISTGEIGIDRESLQARVLSVAFTEGDVDLDRLTTAQRDAAEGLYAATVAAWIQHLAHDREDFRVRFRERRTVLRAKFAGHHRVADNLADMLATLELVAEFATSCGALTDQQAFLADAEAALLELAAPITQAIAEEAVAERFLRHLQAAFVAGAGHVELLQGGMPTTQAPLLGWSVGSDGTPRPSGPRIGWVDHQHLYLLPEAAIGVVQAIAGRLGQRLPAGQTTIGQRLDDAGLLVQRDMRHLTTKVSVAGGRPRCWVLALASILDVAERTEASDA